MTQTLAFTLQSSDIVQTILQDQTNDQKDNGSVNLKTKYFELYKEIFWFTNPEHVTALHAKLYEYIK